MKRVLLGSGSFIAATIIAGTSAYAACSIDKATEYTKEDMQVNSSELRADLRQMRRTAIMLKDYCKDDACQRVVAEMKEIRQNHAEAEQTRRKNIMERTGREYKMVPSLEKTYEEKVKEKMAKAEPISKIEGQVRANNILDVDLIGSQGEAIGTIEDLIFQPGDKTNISHVIVGFGGFLGLAEDQVAIPFSQIKVTFDEDNNPTYYIPMTYEQLENAPRFKRDTYNWMSDQNWQDKNDNFYMKDRT